VVQRPTNLPRTLTEVSGIALSRHHPGTIWSHNDSGDGSFVYAIDSSGRLINRVEVDEAANRDWEDMSISGCSGGDCLYLADIGDNDSGSNNVSIYRVLEPPPDEDDTEPAVEFRARYPGGPRDAEAIFVLPEERVFVVSKGVRAPIEIFRFPGSLPARVDATGRRPDVAELERVLTITPGPVELPDRITGADASADGSWVVLRTHVSLLVYRTDELLGSTTATPIHVDLKPLAEAQGEGVAFGPDNTIYLTSEGSVDGLPGTLAILRCSYLSPP
jgi:hypothetical protein